MSHLIETEPVGGNRKAEGGREEGQQRRDKMQRKKGLFQLMWECVCACT